MVYISYTNQWVENEYVRLYMIVQKQSQIHKR